MAAIYVDAVNGFATRLGANCQCRDKTPALSPVLPMGVALLDLR
jgi:hypothetical protein